MAQIRAEIKRGVLRTLYRQAVANVTGPPGALLSDALAAFQDSGFAGIKSGRLVIAASGAGHSVTFNPPQSWQSFTQDEVFSLSEELFAAYDSAKANLGGSPTDAQIFAAMMADDRLATITTTQKDFSTLRWATRL